MSKNQYCDDYCLFNKSSLSDTAQRANISKSGLMLLIAIQRFNIQRANYLIISIAIGAIHFIQLRCRPLLLYFLDRMSTEGQQKNKSTALPRLRCDKFRAKFWFLGSRKKKLQDGPLRLGCGFGLLLLLVRSCSRDQLINMYYIYPQVQQFSREQRDLNFQAEKTRL